MIWFTSDTHYFHRNILGYCDRPFDNVLEMNRGLIRAWNYRVAKDDLVYHLGDVSFGGQEETNIILQQLHGEIQLIKGNHDRTWKSDKITKIHHELNIEVDGQQVCMTHKPQDTWHLQGQGSWHLHGHLHGNPYHDPSIKRRVDVGVDCWNYKPINLQDIREYFEKQG